MHSKSSAMIKGNSKEIYSNIETSNIKRLKELEVKNRKIKHTLAEMSLKSQFQEVIIKSFPVYSSM
ncbi:hypothetical protein BHC57_07125 [Snodgrassella alvi]|jgi:putative transposase|uniref:Transposase n=1 Tax=Snodgrassella alvi TaxID=1196083 RepID=A0A855FVS6_9NEIS|nr:hypothetical protein BHC57_07125 [Snodgrassella alvi]